MLFKSSSTLRITNPNEKKKNLFFIILNKIFCCRSCKKITFYSPGSESFFNLMGAIDSEDKIVLQNFVRFFTLYVVFYTDKLRVKNIKPNKMIKNALKIYGTYNPYKHN